MLSESYINPSHIKQPTQAMYPLICTGTPCTENTTGLHWIGEFSKRDDKLLNISQNLGDDCKIKGTYIGTYDDEWSIHFIWSDAPLDYREREYWVEAWYDHETEDFHCCVRRVCDDRARLNVYGPNPGQKYYKPKPKKTLKDFAEMLKRFPWDHFVTHQSIYHLDAERARSREHKAWLKLQSRKLALAMALHSRMGAESGIAGLGGDLVAEVMKLL